MNSILNNEAPGNSDVSCWSLQLYLLGTWGSNTYSLDTVAFWSIPKPRVFLGREGRQPYYPTGASEFESDSNWRGSRTPLPRLGPACLDRTWQLVLSVTIVADYEKANSPSGQEQMASAIPALRSQGFD